MDIVKRLHESPCSGDIGCAHKLCVEAAEEIERLREEKKLLMEAVRRFRNRFDQVTLIGANYRDYADVTIAELLDEAE
jgi:hypothetical protein